MSKDPLLVSDSRERSSAPVGDNRVNGGAVSLFVTNHGFLEGAGGVQWCSREYLETARGAGFTSITAYDVDRSLRSRFWRLVQPHPYENVLPSDLTCQVLQEAHNESAHWILLNNAEALPLATELRRKTSEARIVYLSHGAELVDVVNNLRLSPETMPTTQRGNSWLGELLKREIEHRTAIDGVVCISEEDEFIERWLGTRHTVFIPRQIPESLLSFAPVGRRVGCVATLNHGPNLHGLRLFAQALQETGVSLRLVGSPLSIGGQLQNQYRSVEYLGPLDQAGLEVEARTWTSFVNPIFCNARGASTKVATALGWGLPVLTTRAGARGYRWDEEALPLADSAQQLAATAAEFARMRNVDEISARVAEIVSLAPSKSETSETFRRFLLCCDN